MTRAPPGLSSPNKQKKKRRGPFKWMSKERSTTFPPPARDDLVASSMSSHSYVQVLKPKVKGFEKFVPRPTVKFGYETPTPPPVPRGRISPASRKHRLISEEELVASRTVDNIADDLDAHGLREAMERDRRRREAKKQAEHERIERRMERRMRRAREAEDEEFGTGMYVDDEPLHAEPSSSLRPEEARHHHHHHHHHHASSGAHTPLSWLRDPSNEDVSMPWVHEPTRISSPTRGAYDAIDIEALRSDIAEVQQLPATPQHSAPTSPQQAISPASGRSSFGASGRAKWTSFLKRATASRIRKEHSSNRINPNESTFVSDSEDDDIFGPPIHRDRNDDERTVTGSAVRLHGPHADADVRQEDESGCFVSASGEYISGSNSRPQTFDDSPTLNSEGHPHSPHSPRVSYIDILPEGRILKSRSSITHKHDNRAVSPNAPSAVSTLASIDSEGSWLSGKISRQSFRPTSVSLSRQSNYPSPLRASTSSLQHRYNPDEDEEDEESDDSDDDDEYFGRIENRISYQATYSPTSNKHNSIQGQTQLNLTDSSEESGGEDEEEEEEEEEVTRTLQPTDGNMKDGPGKSPQLHDNTWRMSSRMGYLDDFIDEDDAPPSPTRATVGGYDLSPGKRLQHPFAREGENFVTPLESLAETRPQYTGTHAL